MKKSILILIFLLNIPLALLAQGEANIWYFGENAGLDFNNCAPSAITNGELNTIEGCSTFSDANGNLLFYSDGTTVWNRNHIIMPNGQNLLGDPSSSQSAMIIPKPGSFNLYYIFTVGASDEPGFNYYTIDMNADGGLGDIIAGPIDLSQGRSSQWTEKVAAVKGDESGTFWVISYVSGEFYTYKVSRSGVAQTPITSSTPVTPTDRRGYLKVSPDGSKIAIAHSSDFLFLLYDFDDSTGIVINERQLPLVTAGNRPYGVEFSANSKKLYLHASNDGSTLDDDTNSHFSTLFQFDVSLPSTTDIINSRTVIDSRPLFRGALQLGPDKKIYRSLARSYITGIPLLGVIDNPNEDGLSCNYQHASVGLLGNLSTQGLPPFIACIFSQIKIIGENPNGTVTALNGQTINLCVGNDFNVYPESLSGSAEYNWYFNNSSTPFSNASSLQFNNITLADAGSYSLEVEHTDLCGNTSLLEGLFYVDIVDYPIIQSPIVLNNCDEDGTPDGYTDYNLEEANNFITNSDPSLIITYHLSFIDADTGSSPINSNQFNNIDTLTPNTVYARVENSNGCHSISIVSLQVSTTSFPSSYSGEIIEECDDDIIDGLHLFDLSILSANFLSQFPTSTNLSVHYYKDINDAHLEQNEIPTNQLYMSDIPFLQTLFVRIESDITGDCFGIGPFVTLIVNPRPEFEIDTTATICLNQESFISLEIFNPNDIYDYQWTGPNGFNSSLVSPTVSSEGMYTVVASKFYPTTGLTCYSNPHTITVNKSNIANIDIDDVTIIDFSNNNTITITNDSNNLGIGDYEFSLDYEFGPYQASPTFEMVAPGIHTIYILDKNGCGPSQLKVSVVGFPKFFTPNNDGFNDTWHVLGVNRNFYTTSIIRIFDRFGKIVANIKPSSDGWDGLYNNKELPETDYWFTAQLIDNNGNIREQKGHFSLIRR